VRSLVLFFSVSMISQKVMSAAAMLCVVAGLDGRPKQQLARAVIGHSGADGAVGAFGAAPASLAEDCAIDEQRAAFTDTVESKPIGDDQIKEAEALLEKAQQEEQEAAVQLHQAKKKDLPEAQKEAKSIIEAANSKAKSIIEAAESKVKGAEGKLRRAQQQVRGSAEALRRLKTPSPQLDGHQVDLAADAEGAAPTTVAAGKSHMVAIDRNGKLNAWGNQYNSDISGAVDGLWVRPEGGAPKDTCLISNGRVAWRGGGYSDVAPLEGGGFSIGDDVGKLDAQGRLVLEKGDVWVKEDKAWVSVAAGRDVTAAIDSTGALYVWGVDQKTHPAPTLNKDVTWDTVAVATGRYKHLVAIDSTGKLHAWGSDGGDWEQNVFSDGVGKPDEGVQFRTVAAGEAHTAAIDLSGKLYVWGAGWKPRSWDRSDDEPWWEDDLDFKGEIPESVIEEAYTTVVRGELVRVPEKREPRLWRTVTAGYRHTAAIDISGDLWIWGSTERGQSSGFNTRVNGPWRAVAAGAYHTAAINEQGRLFVWGKGPSRYELKEYFGDDREWSFQEDKTQPVLEPGVTWKTVAAGYDYVAAVDSTGKLHVWGQPGEEPDEDDDDDEELLVHKMYIVPRGLKLPV